MGTFVENVNTLASQLTDSNVLNIQTVVTNAAAIATVSTNIADVQAVATDMLAITSLTSDLTNVNNVANDLTNIDAVAADLVNIDSVAADLLNIDNVAADLVSIKNVDTHMSDVTSTATNIVDVVTVSSNMLSILDVTTQVIPNLTEILAADTNAATATSKASEAQLSAWVAEANKLTADSYATEAENVFVKVYTSNGDGTFTATNTTEYSSFHWTAKATTLVTTGIIDDTAPQLIRVYSSDLTQSLHDSQQSSIDGLITSILALTTSNAQAQFGYGDNAGIYVVDVTTSYQTLPFDIVVQSNDTSKFTLNTDNTITIDAAGTYTFISSMIFKNESAADMAAAVMTFQITDGTTIYFEQTSKIQISAGSKDSIAFNSLVNVPTGTTFPITGYIQVKCDIAGYRISQYSSILSLTGGSVQTAATIDAALGTIYEGLV